MNAIPPLPTLTPITDSGDFLIKTAPGQHRPATDAEARSIDSRQIHEHLEALLKSLPTPHLPSPISHLHV